MHAGKSYSTSDCGTRQLRAASRMGDAASLCSRSNKACRRALQAGRPIARKALSCGAAQARAASAATPASTPVREIAARSRTLSPIAMPPRNVSPFPRRRNSANGRFCRGKSPPLLAVATQLLASPLWVRSNSVIGAARTAPAQEHTAGLEVLDHSRVDTTFFEQFDVVLALERRDSWRRQLRFTEPPRGARHPHRSTAPV